MVRVGRRSATFYPPEGAAALIGDFTDWERNPIPLEGPLTLEFPEGAYVEYAFLDREGRPFPDPDNPEKAENPWWSYPRAIKLPGFRYEAPPAPKEEPKVHRHRLGERRFYVAETGPSPKATVVAQDGVAFYRTAGLHKVARALFEEGEIPPVRLVFVEPIDRNTEYRFNEAYEAEFHRVLEEVEGAYGPLNELVLVGASLGGLFSLWQAWRHPERFPKVLALSPALKAHPGGKDAYRDEEWLLERFAEARRLPRVYVEVGLLEWLLGPNRRFAALLADRKAPHAYRERPSGHNWVTWKQALAPGLRYLLGPQ
ncbi:ferric enterobactin esterase [Thermus thermophilus]|uniref:alpha/beta hydrolase-fold protein n=1 Tax=Thermus thermophilus TaxID=274 RepID=UPI001FCC152E|nr:alpha/beta hydrolase-fold protein [Thermus thermophilus]BDG19290.1 ferric enterobactin esterase [Thermus thermophilus]